MDRSSQRTGRNNPRSRPNIFSLNSTRRLHCYFISAVTERLTPDPQLVSVRPAPLNESAKRSSKLATTTRTPRPSSRWRCCYSSVAAPTRRATYSAMPTAGASSKLLTPGPPDPGRAATMIPGQICYRTADPLSHRPCCGHATAHVPSHPILARLRSARSTTSSFRVALPCLLPPSFAPPPVQQRYVPTRRCPPRLPPP
jgi:hypothetical protein